MMSLTKPNMKDQTMLNMVDSSPQKESHDKPALTSWSRRHSCMYCMGWTFDSYMAASHLNENCSTGARMCYPCKDRQLTSARPIDFTLMWSKNKPHFSGCWEIFTHMKPPQIKISYRTCKNLPCLQYYTGRSIGKMVFWGTGFFLLSYHRRPLGNIGSKSSDEANIMCVQERRQQLYVHTSRTLTEVHDLWL